MPLFDYLAEHPEDAYSARRWSGSMVKRGAAMRRREFVSVIAGAIAWPLVARAQPKAMPVIGWIAEVAEVPLAVGAAFRRGMAELGYVEGKNFATEYRLRPELLSQAAADLVRLNVNAIFAAAPAALAAVSNATTGIPVVGVDLESDPIAKGYVKSLGRPGGNVTGMFLDVPELSGKQVGLLKEIVPRLSRLAIFGVPGLNALQFAATETAARTFAVDAEITEVLTPADFEGAMDAARARHVDAGILLSSPLVFTSSKANRRTCAGQTASLHFLVRRISKKRRFVGLWAEFGRDVQKMRGLRRENPARGQAR